ncbi:aldose 1-epimerase [Larkinella bovis]|uniref:Aldose 1-epimerase n=1 Tax=Larkinella bovis TaxID=683041 RepID=A0ABW0IBF7_9BACT
MPFEIVHQPFGSFTEYVIQNTETGEFFTVLPAHGAVIRQLVLRQTSRNDVLKRISLLHSPNSQQALLADEAYASALLFPFPSRIRHGIYAFEGEMFTLPLNEAKQDNAIHGFVAGQPFELFGQEITELEAALTLRYVHDGSYPGYPFPFDFRIRYALSAAGLSVRYDVQNTGNRNAPVCFGWHPYFTLNGEPVDQLTISLPAAKRVQLDDHLLPVGEEPFTEQGDLSLHQRELDAAFVVENNTSQGVTTVLRSAAQGLQLNVWQETGPGKFGYLVVYTPIGRDNIAIEPLTSNVNALNNGEGLIRLAPNETANGTIKVWVS